MVPLNVISKFASTHFDSEPPWSLPSPSSVKTSQKDGEVSATMSVLSYYAAEVTMYLAGMLDKELIQGKKNNFFDAEQH